MDTPRPGPDAALRQQAVAVWLKKNISPLDPLAALSPEATRAMLHDLGVHQIELEMQNEELRRTQVALEAARTRYFDLFDLAPVGYCTVSDQGLIIEANLTTAILLGVVRAELVNRRLSQFILREDQDIYYRQRKLLVASGTPVAFELRMTKKDGGGFPAQMTATTVHDDTGTPICRLVINDVSERVRLHEQLLQAEKMSAIGQLAGGIAHDFNNQLAGITGFAELLANVISDPRQRKWIDAILGAAQRSADLTRQLLAFARKGQSRCAPVDLHSTIKDVVDLLRRSLDPLIIITQHFTDQRAWTLGDADQLHHALLNLALNARDAMPGGGALSFTTRVVELEANCNNFANAAGRFVEIAVCDTGLGMDAETRRHIFEPFFTTKEQGKGTGLGLAAVYGVIQNHGGAIAVASTPGHGSIFAVQVPLFEGRRATVPARAIPPPRAMSAAYGILVVDDETVVCDLTGEMLRDLGHVAITCSDIDQALALCHSDEPFDLVMLDLTMPKRSCREAFTALRAARPGLRVLLMSGHSLNGEVQGILDLGANGFLQKPFRKADVVRAIYKALSVETKEYP